MKDDLPFAPLSKAWGDRLRDAKARGEIAEVVNCFGTDKFEIVGKKLIVKVYNPKLDIWQEMIAVEYEDVCPVCGKLMVVRAIEGSTWIGVCSQACFERYREYRKELFSPGT